MIPGGLEPEGTRLEGPVRSSSRPDEWSVGRTGGVSIWKRCDTIKVFRVDRSMMGRHDPESFWTTNIRVVSPDELPECLLLLRDGELLSRE